MEDYECFALDLGGKSARMSGQKLEDVLYNCLDFCQLRKKKAHFYLAGADAIHHPELWDILALLRAQEATFSILSEPEQSEFEAERAKRSPAQTDTVQIHANGEADLHGAHLGNLLDDRLADLWDLYHCKTITGRKES